MGREIFPISDTLRESYPKLQNEVIRQQDEDARLSRRIEEHKKSKDHPAENITYDGKVKKDNVRDAIDEMDARVNNIVSQGGDDNTEVVDARHSTLKGKTFNVLKERLDDIEGDLLDPKEIEFSDYGPVIPLPDAAIGGQLHGSINGDTLTNLANNGAYYSNWIGPSEFYKDGFKIIHESNHRIGDLPVSLKAGVYTLVYSITDTNMELDNVDIRGMYHPVNSESPVYFPTVREVGTHKILLDVTDDVEMISLYVVRLDAFRGKYGVIKNVMILEGDYTNRSINHIEGIKSIPASLKIKSVGKNLLNVNDGYVTQNTTIDKDIITTKFESGALHFNSGRRCIRLNPHTKYTFSAHSATGDPISLGLYMYDSSGTLFRSYNVKNNISGAVTLTTPHDGCVAFCTNGTVDFFNEYSYRLQVEKGDTASEYEPYKESTAYIVANDKDNKIVNLNRLPNGVADEIDLDRGELIKTTSNWTVLDESNDWSFKDNQVGFKRVEIRNYLDVIKYPKGTPVIAFTNNIRFINQSTVLAPNCIEIWNGNLYVSLPNTDTGWGEDYAPTVQEIKNYIANNPITLTYQLAEPETIPIQWRGINTYRGGQIEISNTFPEIGFYYKQGLKSHYPNYPIKQVTELYKVDKETGLRTSVDISKCVISDDKLSFTHPDLKNGDLCDWDYITEDNFPYTQCDFATGTNMSASVASLLKNDDLKKELIRQLWSGLDGHRRDLKMHVTPELKEDIEDQGTVLNIHVLDSNNPHAVDKGQIGLSNVDNTKQASKKEFDEHISGPFHIVESGGNENGHFIKYADGTMECYIAELTLTYTDNSNYRDTFWVFPAPFIDQPAVFATHRTPFQTNYIRQIPAIRTVSNTAKHTRIIQNSPDGTTFKSDDYFTVSAKAIGKWK